MILSTEKSFLSNNFSPMAISLVPCEEPVRNYSYGHSILNLNDFSLLFKAKLSMENWRKFLFVRQHYMKSFTFKSKTEKQWNKIIHDWRAVIWK